MRYFESFFILEKIPKKDKKEKVPTVLYRFDVNKQSIVEKLITCSFYERDENESEEIFNYYLQYHDESGIFYLFCIHWYNVYNKTQEVYCLLTRYNWYAIFNGFLVICHSHRIADPKGFQRLENFLKRFSKVNFPKEGQSTLFFDPAGSNRNLEIRFKIVKPFFNSYIFLEYPLLPLFNLLDSTHIFSLLAAIFKNRKVIFYGKGVHDIYNVINGLLGLVAPFKYPGTIIPFVVSVKQLDDLKIMNDNEGFIIGVDDSMVDDLFQMDKKNLLVVNLNSKTIIGGENIHNIFPRNLLESVYIKLQKIMPFGNENKIFDSKSVSELFLKFMVDVFGNYRMFVKKEKNNMYSFNDKKFVEYNKYESMKVFYEVFCKSEMFKIWLEERYKMIDQKIYLICNFENECAKIYPKFYTTNSKKILKEGYLVKEGKVRKSWRKRYFRMYQNHTLKYFKNKYVKKPKGEIRLVNIEFEKIVYKKPNCFQIKCFDRTYYISAANDNEREEWLKAIKTYSLNIEKTNLGSLEKSRKGVGNIEAHRRSKSAQGGTFGFIKYFTFKRKRNFKMTPGVKRNGEGSSKRKSTDSVRIDDNRVSQRDISFDILNKRFDPKK